MFEPDGNLGVLHPETLMRIDIALREIGLGWGLRTRLGPLGGPTLQDGLSNVGVIVQYHVHLHLWPFPWDAVFKVEASLARHHVVQTLLLEDPLYLLLRGEYDSNHMSLENTHTNLRALPRFHRFLDGPLLLNEFGWGLRERPSLEPLLDDFGPKFSLEASFVPADTVRGNVLIEEILLVLSLPGMSHGTWGINQEGKWGIGGGGIQRIGREGSRVNGGERTWGNGGERTWGNGGERTQGIGGEEMRGGKAKPETVL
jgi:hypothetical protein